MTMRVSIVTYHTAEAELAACLDSVLACDAVDRVDIIDNGNEARLSDFCRGCYPRRVEYVANENRGYGAGHNVSLRRSLADSIDYHLVLNSDVYFPSGTLEKCLDFMEKNKSIGQLIPRTVFPDGSFQPVCHRIPTPLDLLMHRFAPKSFMKRWRDHYEMRDCDLTKPLNVPYHHGCFMLFRVSALRDTGLFDERFFMYPEDIDMTRRVHERYETVYYPGASIVHAHRAESRVNFKLLRIHAVNMLRYFCKWGFFLDKKRRNINKALNIRLANY